MNNKLISPVYRKHKILFSLSYHIAVYSKAESLRVFKLMKDNKWMLSRDRYSWDEELGIGIYTIFQYNKIVSVTPNNRAEMDYSYKYAVFATDFFKKQIKYKIYKIK